MKAAWQFVASVAMSTMPLRTRSRSSEEETVLMTAYSVSFSRCTRVRASPPPVAGETVKRALLGSERPIVAARAPSPYVPYSHSLTHNDVSIIRCEKGLGESTVAPEGRWIVPANLQPSTLAMGQEAA